MTPQIEDPLTDVCTEGSDIPDTAARRRVQNRLNQRASRKRKALKSKSAIVSNNKWVIYTESSKVPKNTSPVRNSSPQSNHLITQISHPTDDHQHHSETKLSTRDPISTKALYMIESPVLFPSLSSATKTNLFNAFFSNAQLMGLTWDILNDDLASQFNLVGPSSLHLPPPLWPSKSQKEIIHHPWIDLIPMLSLRESILARVDTIDEDQACEDLYGGCITPDEAGLRVWGDAWDPLAYEASEALITKWSWMAKECPDIIQSTNYWRRRRGEKALMIRN